MLKNNVLQKFSFNYSVTKINNSPGNVFRHRDNFENTYFACATTLSWSESCWNCCNHETMKPKTVAIMKQNTVAIMKLWNQKLLQSWNHETENSCNHEIMKPKTVAIMKPWNRKLLQSWNCKLLQSWNHETENCCIHETENCCIHVVKTVMDIFIYFII